MKRSSILRIFEASCILMLAAMFTIPLINERAVSLVTDTMSDIGAQGVSYAWIFNSITIILAMATLKAGWDYYEGFVFHRMILMIFCVSLAMSALINKAPVIAIDPVNINEDAWHQFFLGTEVLSFIILSISTSFINEKRWERNLAVSSGISVMLFAILTYRYAMTAGIWNRLMLITIIGWMAKTFRKF